MEHISKNVSLSYRQRLTIISLGILIISFLLRIFSNRLISTHLDVTDFGNYTAIVGSMTLFASIMLIGSDMALNNFIPEYFSSKHWGKAKGYVIFFGRFFLQIIFAILVITVVIKALGRFDVELHFEQFISSHMASKYLWLSPIILLTYFFSKLLRALRHQILSQILLNFLFRGLQIVILCVLLYKHVPYTIENTVVVFAIAYGTTLILIFLSLNFIIPQHILAAPLDTSDRKLWIKVASEIFVANFFFANTGTIIIIADKIFDLHAHNAGFLSIIMLTASVFWLSSNAVQLIYSPEMRPYVSQKRYDILQKIINESFLSLLWPTLFLLLIFVIFHHIILGFFGAQYAQLFYPALFFFIFCVLPVLTTPLMIIMLYGGEQHVLAVAATCTALVTFSIGALIIHSFGFWGAICIASAIQLTAAAIPTWYIKKKMNIVPYKFGFNPPKDSND
jgi:O-antigen/teichoic acid export membrane protein